jgi:hypothetical protein
MKVRYLGVDQHGRGMCETDRLPRGLTPRLLSENAAAAYLGIHRETFEEHVRLHIPPVEIGARKLWDIKALDCWLDQQSGLVEALRPTEDWLAGLGDDRGTSSRY